LRTQPLAGIALSLSPPCSQVLFVLELLNKSVFETEPNQGFGFSATCFTQLVLCDGEPENNNVQAKVSLEDINRSAVCAIQLGVLLPASRESRSRAKSVGKGSK